VVSQYFMEVQANTSNSLGIKGKLQKDSLISRDGMWEQKRGLSERMRDHSVWTVQSLATVASGFRLKSFANSHMFKYAFEH
jgi:hypothetical protein